jgi:hypothetical protein
MKKLFALLSAVITGVVAFAQSESILPLNGNLQLQQQATAQPKAVLNKTQALFPKQFPITEHFYKTIPDTLYWQSGSGVTLSSNTAIFNAQNAAGTTYSSGDGTFGLADELTSNQINLNPVPDNCYISFDYEMGDSWQPGDSLVLQAQNAAGNWDNIWRSVAIKISRRNVQFNFPLGLLYQHAGFKLRWQNYSSRSAVNTNTFRLFNFVFALKLNIPFYENIFWNNTQTYRNTWRLMQGEQRSGFGINWGNVIKLDAQDVNGNNYSNGFNDTIESHAIDLSKLNARDSVYFRFYYRGVSNQNNDSLILQFKNNGGLWITQFVISAAQASVWNSYTVNVNGNRLNHANFGYRIITRGLSNDSLKWVVSGFHIGQKALIPFVDDFSSNQIYPDQNKWLDRLVFVNNRFPIAPPSINVATFDGLNRVGVPYGFGRGYCDTLTSLPIKLNGLTAADSVYLSFFVQPQGLGMEPDFGDSLMLFGRYTAASPDSFNLLWRGAPSDFLRDSFLQVRIALPGIYLHDEFQMRFINIGSRTGNLSHWHLDYVYLNRGRNINDAITDIAIQEYPSPLLKKYSAMPFSHFKAAPATYTNDTQYFGVSNNSNQSYAIDYGREIFDQNFARIDTFGSIISILPSRSSRTASIKKTINIAGNFNDDSVVVWSRFYTRLGTSVDNVRSNDTLWQPTYFINYYAYDDGTAEAGYGIKNSVGKVALKYTFAKPDSLYGMAVHFNRSVNDVSTLPFNLMVWKNISLTSEEPILSIPSNAVYYNARNGFYYVKFSQPIYVDNEIYIGWEQNQQFELNVGLDFNFKVDYKYAPNPEMFYNVQGLWQSTDLPGALMMRPVVGKWIDPLPVGYIEYEKEKLQVTCYPNPNDGTLFLSGLKPSSYTISVVDVMGREVFKQKDVLQQISLADLTDGLYMVHVTDEKSATTTVQKIILQR